MLKLISVLHQQNTFTPRLNYDGNQEEVRFIYQDCLEEMRTAKWENIGYNPHISTGRFFSDNLVQKLKNYYPFQICLYRGACKSVPLDWKEEKTPEKTFNKQAIRIFVDSCGDYHIINLLSETYLIYVLYALALNAFPKENLHIDEDSHFNAAEQLLRDIHYFMKDLPQTIIPDTVTILPIIDHPKFYDEDIMNHLLTANPDMQVIKKQTKGADEKSILNHAILFRYKGKIHLALHIYDLYSDMSYYGVKAVLNKWPHVQINQCGFTGAISKELPIGSLIIPMGVVKYIDRDQPPLTFQNAIMKTSDSPSSLIFVENGHYCSPCRFKEHEAAKQRLEANGKTIEMETYPILKVINEARNAGNTSIPNPKIIHIIANYTAKTATSNKEGMEAWYKTALYQNGLKLLPELLFN